MAGFCGLIFEGFLAIPPYLVILFRCYSNPKLYDRRSDEISLDEVEKIAI
jgi:hypothetical protein